jgi:hypothetical protein
MERNQQGADLADDTVISRAGDWLGADTGDGMVMMSPAAARYIGISETGGAIWRLLETPQTLARLCQQLAREYDTSSADLRDDVVEFVGGLVARGALALG